VEIIMILSKTPLRITLGGGGTDLPLFYTKEDGFWISGAINKFIYIIVKKRFEKSLRVAYSALEYVEHPSHLEHPIIREALEQFNLTKNIEIAVFADLPARTGLGSSGTFTVGLLHTLHTFVGDREKLTSQKLAEEAFNFEQSLGRITGKQDPYIASLGGVKVFTINNKGVVKVKDSFKLDVVQSLQEHLSLFYVDRRKESTNAVLKRNPFQTLLTIKQLGLDCWKYILEEDFILLGNRMNEHWKIKQTLSGNKPYDKYIQLGLRNGAYGGKLIGAGAGGFVLFVHSRDKKESLIKVLTERGLRHVPFQFTNRGTEVYKI